MSEENKEIRERIVELNPKALFMDGLDRDKFAFDDAIIGIASRCAMPHIIVYSESKVIDILMKKYEMTDLDAIEWFDYNMIGAYLGEGTPMFLSDIEEY
jgi:hypothetical protein